MVLQTTSVLQWIATHVDFKCMVVVSNEGKVVGYLTPSSFHSMHHLKPVEAKCNKEYLDSFNVKFPKSYKLMKHWYREEESFKDRVDITKYNPKEFNLPAQFLTAILSHLHGEAECTTFNTEWIPIAHGVMFDGIIFNWASMLSQNLLKALERAMQKSDPNGTTFYCSAYLMDILCASNSFLGMKWAWNPQICPIHLYCKELQKENSFIEMYIICNHFLAEAHQLLFGSEMPRITKAGRDSISLIGNQYMLRYFTYICLAGIMVAPHLLPRYVHDKLLLKKFSFQLFEIDQTIDLLRRKLKAWPKLPIPVGPYQILNHGHAMKELEGYLDYIWLPGTICRHNPKGLIVAHLRRLGLTTSYKHETSSDDSLFEDVKIFEGVVIWMCLKRILEDQITTLDQDPEVDQLEWRRQCFKM